MVAIHRKQFYQVDPFAVCLIVNDKQRVVTAKQRVIGSLDKLDSFDSVKFGLVTLVRVNHAGFNHCFAVS